MSMKILSAFLALTLLSGTAQAAVVLGDVTTESVLLADNVTLATRYREFESVGRNGNDFEHFLGRGDLGGGPNRVQSNLQYAAASAGTSANAFSLSLTGGTLASVLNGNSLSIANAFAFAGASADQPFDTLEFGLRDGANGNGTFTLTNLKLTGTTYLGQAVVDQALADIAAVDGGGFRYRALTGIDFRQNFTLTGTLNLIGGFGNSAELNRLEMRLGNGPITQPAVGGVPEPATWAMMILGFGLIGAAVRRRRGGLVVEAA
jgi:hypothetical protein